jgi:hypothetical protein
MTGPARADSDGMTNKIRKTAPTVVTSLILSAAAVGLCYREAPTLPQFEKTAAADRVIAARSATSPDAGPAVATTHGIPHVLKAADIRFTRSLSLAVAP